MANRNDRTKQEAELRLRAEEVVMEVVAGRRKSTHPFRRKRCCRPSTSSRSIKFELKMQNLELLRTQSELDAALARYLELYDLAPVGCSDAGRER